MRKFKLVVMTRPVAGKEDEYNRWYQNEHLRDVVAVPGFQAAQRFSLNQVLIPGATAAPYLAIYDIETDDIDAAVKELTRRAERGEMAVSPALDTDGGFAAIYEELGAKAVK